MTTATQSIGNPTIAEGFAGLSNQQVMGSANGISSFQMIPPGTSVYSGEVGNFSPSQNTFDLRLTLTDRTSGARGSLLFNGGVLGSVSFYGVGSAGAATTDLTLASFTTSTQSLRLGNNLYTVTPLKGGDGPLSVQVSAVPEPASLALLGSGLAGLGWHFWRWRRVLGRD